ncbi:hypothetical protein G6F70_008096 [Rhizopus microsporus]|nr:hypothetical protein G6F71_008093 [Rhizopus microsporus]KAG1195611.1 hypothetical protein G6F70_008096 [Rhizopus microsporus]KAG1207446.1 hypothetical protein G6F69_008038 [Rhizopus microsporus]KAG1228233.1 hypothetical protein G6F67_007956 [Rhizopus microsporus]KAG1260204.1 hypothetical protein G6F68_007601 [Rhizopus microsporus]
MSQDVHADLPTLDQVLSRKTLPPVCLYNFYIVMRDRLKMEEILDFYLDLQHHELLWKKYVKAMHRTGHLSEDDLSEGYQSPRLLSRLSHSPQQEEVEKIPSRKELAESAQRLLLRYLVPSATKEVTQLPSELRESLVKDLQKTEARDDPLLFAEAKQYILEYMQRFAYPKFLRLKAWGNVTLYQQLGRLVVGLVCYPQWGTRFWILLPFWLGVYNMLVFLTGLDPLWVLVFNKSETTTFKFNSIKQPQVKRILVSRSIWQLGQSIIISVICTIIFCAIPPHRL